jgi:multiple sugar transport system permease protein/putative aldouronate transport system permease protein
MTKIAGFKHRGIRYSAEDQRLFSIVTFILMLVAIVILYPLVYVVSASFSSGAAVSTGKVILWPVDPTMDGYNAVFTYQRVAVGFRNSIFYTVFGTVINVIMTLMAAYPLSRKNFQGRKIYTTLFIITMFFSGGIIPLYILITQLRMINTVWAILLPGAISTYNMIITRTFFMSSIPNELLEASQIDGCSNIRYFFVILLPLSKAIIAVIALYYGVGHWNAWFGAMLFLRNPDLQPLQLVLRDILVLSNINFSDVKDARTLELLMNISELLKYSLIVVSTIPIIIVYPFIQKYFVKGALIGSLKG